MTPDEIRFDSKALEQWANEGGFYPPDEEAAEQHRIRLTQLRKWVTLLTQDANDARLLLDILRGTISLAGFANSLGLNRSNGKRRFERFIAELQERLDERPELLAILPEPWRTLLSD